MTSMVSPHPSNGRQKGIGTLYAAGSFDICIEYTKKRAILQYGYFGRAEPHAFRVKECAKSVPCFGTFPQLHVRLGGHCVTMFRLRSHRVPFRTI